jgi:hypothetical protein
MGFVIGGGCVKPEQNKIEIIERYPIARTKTQVRSFLGITGYYRKFIPQYATIAYKEGDTRNS